MQILKSRVLKIFLSTIGAIGLGLTVLGHLKDVLTFVGFVRVFVEQWAEWQHDLWNWLFWCFGFQVPEIVARGLTFNLSAILLVVGTLLHPSPEDLSGAAGYFDAPWRQRLRSFRDVPLRWVLASNCFLAIAVIVGAINSKYGIQLVAVLVVFNLILLSTIVAANGGSIFFLYAPIILELLFLVPSLHHDDKAGAIFVVMIVTPGVFLVYRYCSMAMYWRLVRVFTVLAFIIVGNEIAKWWGVVPDLPGFD
jgi:hypothetical protein